MAPASPAEPLALEGWCSFTIEGFRESNPTAVAITVTDHLLVKPNDAYTTPKEPTPTQAQQLQTQIDGIVPQVSTLVGNAIEALEQAEEWPWGGGRGGGEKPMTAQRPICPSRR